MQIWTHIFQFLDTSSRNETFLQLEMKYLDCQ